MAVNVGVCVCVCVCECACILFACNAEKALLYLYMLYIIYRF